MANEVFKDRVLETSTTTGTGTLTLLGAVTGYQSFSAVGNGNTCFYTIEEVDISGNPSGAWEVGSGTYTLSGTTLSRTTVISSSNGGSKVNLAAGVKRVFCDVPANQFPPAASTLTGTTLASNVVSSSLTSVGTLSAGSIPYSLLTGTPTVPSAANPTASVGLAAVNGSASTYMRSDGAPTIDQTAAFAFSALGLTTTTVGVRTPKIYPTANSTTAVQILKADGSTAVATVDTTNSFIGVGTTAPAAPLHAAKDSAYASDTLAGLIVGNATTPLKRVMIGYDTAIDATYIQSHHSGTVVKPMCLNPSASPVYVGTPPVTTVSGIGIHVAGTIMVIPTSASFIGQYIRGITSQTGPLLQLQGQSSTTAGRSQAEVDTAWADSTDATRSADLILRAYYTTTAREGIRIRGGSISVQIGLFGVTPVIQPASANQASITDSTGGVAASSLVDVTTAAVADPTKVNANFATINVLLLALRTALVNLGAIKGSA